MLPFVTFELAKHTKVKIIYTQSRGLNFVKLHSKLDDICRFVVHNRFAECCEFRLDKLIFKKMVTVNAAQFDSHVVGSSFDLADTLPQM